MTIPPHLRSTAAALGRDRAAVEVLQAFDRAGVEGILLKGPVIARLLYDDGAPRPYCDVDVLVRRDATRAAGAALDELGFGCLLAERHMHEPASYHAETWKRSRDGASVDLHVSLHGVGASPERLWAAVRPAARGDVLGGLAILVPSLATIALHAMTHAADSRAGPGPSKPVEDLRRAIARFDRAVWLEAADLAQAVDAVAAAAVGLRRAGPEGERLGAELGLGLPAGAVTRLRAQQAPPLAIGVERIRATHGRARWRALRGYALPSASYMRVTFGVRRPGRLPVAWAHVRRVGRHLRELPAAVVARRRLRG